MITQIYSLNGLLNFCDGDIATVDEYLAADRCVGSIFECLEPGEKIELKEGFFVLGQELELVPDQVKTEQTLS